jgi:hypothetical protein
MAKTAKKPACIGQGHRLHLTDRNWWSSHKSEVALELQAAVLEREKNILGARLLAAVRWYPSGPSWTPPLPQHEGAGHPSLVVSASVDNFHPTLLISLFGAAGGNQNLSCR